MYEINFRKVIKIVKTRFYENSKTFLNVEFKNVNLFLLVFDVLTKSQTLTEWQYGAI